MKLIFRIFTISIFCLGELLAQTQQDPYGFRNNLLVNTPYCGDALTAVADKASCTSGTQPGQFVNESITCNLQRPVYQLNSNHTLVYSNKMGWISEEYTIQFYVKNLAWADSQQPLIIFDNGKPLAGLYYKTLPGKTQACLSLDVATNTTCLPLNLNQYYLITVSRNSQSKLLEVFIDNQLVITYTDTNDNHIGVKGQSIKIHGGSPFSSCSTASASFAYLNFNNKHVAQSDVTKTNQQICALVDANSSADFAINPGASCKDGLATITYTGSVPLDSPYIISWDFDGATVLSGQDRGPIEIKWDAAGTKKVRLSVQNPDCGTVLDNIKSPLVTLPTITIDREDGGCGTSSAYIITVKNGAEPLQYASENIPFQSSNRLLLSPGSHTISIRDANACIRDTIINVVQGPISVETLPDTEICEGETIRLLTQSSASNFQWFPAAGLDFNNVKSPSASPQVTTDYIVEATATNPVTGQICSVRDTVKITVRPRLILSITSNQVVSESIPFQLQASVTNAAAGSNADYSWTPATGLDNPTISAPLATVVKTQTYLVTATDTDGCQASGSVTLTVKETNSLGFPSAFSPNGDGINETLIPIYARIFELIELRIYNRWGLLIHRSDHPEMGWDGRYQDRPAPAGHYVWKLSAKKLSGEMLFRSGTVLLAK